MKIQVMKGLVMISDDFLESDWRPERELLQVAVTESIESLKSITPPSLEDVTKKVSIKSLSELADSESVKRGEGDLIDRGSTARETHLN